MAICEEDMRDATVALDDYLKKTKQRSATRPLVSRATGDAEVKSASAASVKLAAMRERVLAKQVAAINDTQDAWQG